MRHASSPSIAGSARLGRVRAQLTSFDLAAALIGVADALETGLARLWRTAGAPLGRRGIGLTAGLAWRGFAALTGIGLATTLVAALSSNPGEASLSSLTIPAGPEGRPVRDVRQEPRHHGLGGDGWVRIARPIAMFGLDSPELERQSPSYEARRSADGAQREDSLVFGVFTEPKPHLLLRLSVERGESPLSQPFVIALVREAAARAMSVQRSGAPTAIETRFGAIETADATLSDGQTSRACIAFRKNGGDPPLGIGGWWCGGPGRPADRQQLACLIDRIDLLAAGDDRSLRAAFARTELKRQPACAPPRLSATGRKTSWLDADGHAPALRTAAKR